MADKSYRLPEPGALCLPRAAADALVRRGDARAALLYLHMLREGGTVTPEDAARALRWTEAAAADALDTLASLGLIAPPAASPAAARATPPPDGETKQYTAAEIRGAMNGKDFPALVDEVQRRLGKLLSTDDLSRLLGMYDSLGLPVEVILLLVGYCTECLRRQYGEGRLPTMRYIEKAAYTWEREGIFSIEKAEEYLRRIELRRSARAQLAAALQIRGRELTKTEQTYVDGWLAMGVTPELAEAAFDRTVVKTGKLSWGYMNSILKSWHEKGVRSPAELEARDSRAAPSGKGKTGAPAPGGGELARVRRMLDEIKKDD